MSDLADNIDPHLPLEVVELLPEPRRTNTALAIADRTLRVLGVVMARSDQDVLFIREEELAQMQAGRIYIGPAKDGLIPVLRDP